MLIHPDPDIKLKVQPGWTLVEGEAGVAALFEATDQFHDGHILELFYLPQNTRRTLAYARMLLYAPYAKPSRVVELFFYGVREFNAQVEDYVEADDVELTVSRLDEETHSEQERFETDGVKFIAGKMAIRAHRLLWRPASEWEDSLQKSQYLDPNLPLEVGDPLGMYLYD